MKRAYNGAFTIVELLIVIVVIAILAAITVVAYNGIQERARSASLQSDLRQASTYLEIALVEDGVYPSDASDIPRSDNTEYEYRLNDDGYCLAARIEGSPDWSYKVTDSTTVADGSCQGYNYAGSPPAGANLAPPLGEWSLYNGATYDPSTGIVTLTNAGSAIGSPDIKVDSPETWRFQVDVKPTSNGGPTFASFYYDSNNNPYTVSGGWPENGIAPTFSGEPGAWTPVVWNPGAIMSGPGLAYMDIEVWNNAAYGGAAGMQIRNPQLIITR